MIATTREEPFIKLFLTAYENGSWADADLVKPDAIDRTMPAADMLATRHSDGRRLAIEHTIIEPFIREKADFADFRSEFTSIEQDHSLSVHGLWVEVFVPVGILRNQPVSARGAIVQSVHEWLRANRLKLRQGMMEHNCPVNGATAGMPSNFTLTIRVTPLTRGSKTAPGVIHIRRQQMESNLGDVIENALRRKLPKLVNTPADMRVLMLERQHMNLLPEMMLAEVEGKRAGFPQLANVNEIWIIETIFYRTAFGGTFLRFERYENSQLISSYDFQGDILLMKFEDGRAEVVNQVT